MNCNGRDSLQYQVNLEGPEGTVKFQMTKICHSMRVAWYHGAFADKDIGQLQRVRFMVCIYHHHACFTFEYVTFSRWFSV